MSENITDQKHHGDATTQGLEYNPPPKNGESGLQIRHVFPKFTLYAAKTTSAFQGPTLSYVETKAQGCLSRYEVLNAVINSFSKDNQEKLKKALVLTVKNDDLLFLLELMFSQAETDEIYKGFRYQNKDNFFKIVKELNNDFILTLLDILLDDVLTYQFQIAIILSQLKIYDLPEALRAEIRPQLIEMDMSIQVSNGNWWLCDESEPRLLQALNNDAVVVVNEYVAVKFIGKRAGLCLKTFTSASGQTFFEGHWYSPTGFELNNTLEDAFDAGITKIDISNGNWALLRPAKRYTPDYLEDIKALVNTIPDNKQAVIDGLIRSQYRANVFENL